jgi:hypothetical protein
VDREYSHFLNPSLENKVAGNRALQPAGLLLIGNEISIRLTQP